MPRIFGRDVLPDHPLEPKLVPLDAAAGPARFVAQNWRYDWRVTEAREQILLTHVCGPTSPAGLRDCYDGYFRTCVCRGDPCEYTQECNRPSRVTGPLRRDAELCRVVCLNAFREAAHESVPYASAVAPDAWPARLTEWIAARRAERGILGVRALLVDLFQAWNRWSKLDRRPAWASFWADVEPVLSRSDWPDAVRDALGLGPYGAGSWLVLLRYQAKDAWPCYRPTSLDADWQAWHVFSPPGRPYGYTMDLSPAGGRCCPEVIHSPRALDIAHWTGHIGRTEAGAGEYTGYDLEALRRRHYGVLRRDFPGAGADWLPPVAGTV
jgi:hypothetical protein